MSDNNYWDDRFEQLNKKQFKKGDEFIKDLEKQYRKAALKIEKDIDHWFNRLAKNNGISRAEAELLLNADELEEFQWTVEEYIAKGMENSINQKYMKELENASAKVHISRLEALLIQMKQHIAEVMDYEDKGLKEVASDVYTEGYYKSSYEIQKRLGLCKELSKLNTEKVEKIISKPWAKDGKNFSKRIWGDHRKELNSMLEEGLTQVITGGGTKDELINKLKGLVSKDINDAKNAAERLVNSELAFINSSSNYDSYIENGVEKYKIVAALELGSGRRTCEKCAAKDGKVYDIEDWEVGKTAPLFHPRCRCTTSPKMDNAITRNAKRTRAAKIDGGKTEHIENMSFSEWEKRYVKDKELANSAESGISGKRINRTEKNTVDLEYINSKDYHNKFKNLTDNKDVNEKIYSQAKAMLTHRNGTNKEDFCLIDSKNGKIVGTQNNNKSDFGVDYNSSIINAIKDNADYSLISLHNHPTNNPPTGSDIVSNAVHKYKFGVVVAHNGKVYMYKAGDKPFLSTTFGNRVDKYLNQGYNEYNSILKTLNDFKLEYNIVWEEI